MNKYLLFASLAFAYVNVTAQDQIDFKTIDIIKSEDSNPNSFASLSNKIYFFANDGKNYSDYYLWSLEKDSKKIEKSTYTVKGNYYKSLIIGNSDDAIYYLDDQEWGKYKLIVLANDTEKEILTDFNNLIVLEKSSQKTIIRYTKNNKDVISKITKDGVEVLFEKDSSQYLYSEIINGQLYLLEKNKLSILDLISKNITEKQIPSDYEVTSNNDYAKINLFNGNIYYTSQDSTTWLTRIIEFNIESNKFKILDIPNSTIYNFYATNDFALFQTYNETYKIDKNNTVSKYDSLPDYYIRTGKVVNDRLFLQLFVIGSPYIKLAEIKNNEVDIHNYEINFEASKFDQNQIFAVKNNGKLSRYNLETRKEDILNNDNLSVSNILGFDESKIYLNASTKETGKELYAFNKNTNQIEFYGDINARPGTYPKRFYNVGNKVFYEGNYQGYNHLYVSDGTLEGTRVVKPDILLTLNNNSSGNTLDGLEFNGKFLFGGNKGNQSGHELWVTDGSDEGTFEIEINPITVGPHSNISGLGSFIAKTPTKVYFKGYIPDKGSEIWVTDGTKEGTKMVKDLALGSDSPILSIPQNVTVGEKLYFVKVEKANDNRRSDLWETDGTNQGTKKITELTEFWNWDSHYSIKIFDADEKYLYYSKYYVAPYGEESLSGTYIHRMNLNDLKEERLYRFYSHYNMISVNNENFYFSEYVDNQFNFVNFNKNTGEKKTILKSVSSDFGYITTCGNYSIIADTDFSGHVGKPYFYNHNNGKVERIFKNDFASSSKNNIACVNDNILINYSDYMDNSNKKLVSIKEDKIIEFPLSLDNSTNINSYLSTEMIYNTGLKKLFINPSNVDNELAVADFYLESLSTEEVEGNSKDLNSLILYPNPTENEVNVKSLSYIQTLTIIDFTGKILKEQKDINQKEIKLNISGLKKGIYIIHVKTENETKSKKLIIK